MIAARIFMRPWQFQVAKVYADARERAGVVAPGQADALAREYREALKQGWLEGAFGRDRCAGECV